MGLFDLEIMRNSYFSEEEFSRGKLIYNKFGIRVKDVKQDMMSDNYTIYSEITEEEEFLTEIEIGKSRVSDSFILASERKCTCKEFIECHENCRHMAALIHFVNEFAENQLLKLQELSSEGTSSELIELKEDFLSQYYNDLHTTAQPAIHPFVMIEEEGFYLTLKIGCGTNKPYVIKDLKIFAEAFDQRIKIDYGKNLSVMHDVGLFDKNCQALLLYILDLIFVKSTSVQERRMTLTEQQLSSIVSYCSNGYINLQSNITEEKQYKVEDIQTPIYVLASNVNDSITLSLCSNVEYVHVLNRSVLCMKDDKLMIIAFEDYNNFKLLKLLRSRHLMIKLEDFFNMYDIILSNLDNRLKIVYDFDISSLLSLTTNFSVDISQFKGNLIITPYLKNDNVKCDILSLESLEISYSHSQILKINKLLRKYATLVDENYVISDNENTYQFLKYGIDKLKKITENVHADDNIKKLKVISNISMEAKLSKIGNHLSLDVLLEGINKEEMAQIIAAKKENKEFFRIQNGSFIDLSSPSLEKIENVVEELGIELLDGSGELPLYKSSLVESLLSDEEFHLQKDSSFLKYLENFDINKIDSTPNIENATLKNYQIEGFRFLKTMEKLNLGAILADDMGLGKTIQVISVLNNFKNLTSCLIVCPSSLILNWQREITRFAPNLRVKIIVGNQIQRKTLLEETDDTQIVITSYDLLKRDTEIYTNRFFEYLIVDEAHFMKNNSSLNFKTLVSINAKHKIAMTGTPIENNLSELWSLMHFIMPNLLGNYSSFSKKYEIPISKFDDKKRLDKLKNIVRPFILRRMKHDVLTELPSKIEEFKYANLQGKHYTAYQEALLEIRETIKNDEEKMENKIIILSMLTKLRQLACDSRLLDNSVKEASPKLQLAVEIIQKSIQNKRKVLLFSQFTSMLDLIEVELNKKGIDFYTLKGSTPKEKRDEMSENFNQDSTMVFLISLKAGGTGLNLTGASTVIHFDPWWNMSAQNQATDRVHRIGQKADVLVYKLISEGTIEEKIVKLQEEKSVLAKNMLDNNSNNIGKLSKDELLDLFSV